MNSAKAHSLPENSVYTVPAGNRPRRSRPVTHAGHAWNDEKLKMVVDQA